MVKITSREGKWKEENFKRELHWEKCPNPQCITKELHYNNSMTDPHCPDCKTKLLGAPMRTETKKRIDYHMEK